MAFDLAFGLRRESIGDVHAHQAHDLGLRADPVEAAFLHHLGKLGVFRQEAITRVDGIGTRHFGRADDGWNVEIALPRWRRSNADFLVCETNMERIGVSRGMNRDRLQAEIATSANHSQCDLTTIRYENLFEHACTVRKR